MPRSVIVQSLIFEYPRAVETFAGIFSDANPHASVVNIFILPKVSIANVMVYLPSHVAIGIITHTDLSIFGIRMCCVVVGIIPLACFFPCTACEAAVGIPNIGAFFGSFVIELI